MKKELHAHISGIVGDRLTDEKLTTLVNYFQAALSDHQENRDEGFFRDLSYEMSNNVKELATLFVDFRQELKSKISPELTEMATKHIPQAADQLEGVIETLEMAANKLMDNLEAMEKNTQKLDETMAALKNGKVSIPGDDQCIMEVELDEKTTKMLAPLSFFVESNLQKGRALISDSFVQMSFQDLTGQRIKRIMGLVAAMEKRLKAMVVSFGVKLSEHDKNPQASWAELNEAVEKKVADLAGPQKAGQGLDQANIDDLLAAL
jgi:chemotaxis protein CheZ